ncbi:MAG TPA: A/G-specific adenine glycosylase [Granulicella sp.]|nr:A/G-specific adenine glycosylase [Granulicella sp.]
MTVARRTSAGNGERDGLDELEVAAFRQQLMAWYRDHARQLPWRGVADPYKTWVSEVMLQQTRVAAVIEHYLHFMKRFPGLVALALAPEEDVLAAWSGLGYYRRARMLHKAARFITGERGGVFPTTAAELRTLPGIGEYTSAAIASIAFGESVAAVDGNVERVLLRMSGRPEQATAAGRAFVRDLAAKLIPERTMGTVQRQPASAAKRQAAKLQGGPRHGWAIAVNAAGDHNQAMMELGATICLPRGPLCDQCPVHTLCRTRGEHVTAPRTKLRSREVAYLLSLRKSGLATQVLLARRAADASQMPSMYELPPLPLDASDDAMTEREPVLRVRHAITNTGYYVRVYAPLGPEDDVLMRALPAAMNDLHWVKTSTLAEMPLTGLAKKVLQRLDVMAVRPLRQVDLEAETQAPAKPGRGKRAVTPAAEQDQDDDWF